ncbi:hypothetical protein BP1258A_4755 [Burkholderia pseudomallei 1258a]|nr:hypothetical protein BP1026A_5133 [Burkholderia pseudomallei 1026a]EIF55298.1 hypothetical protein BP1258A_4755 [Burkholderia pseudomallei 1258a]NAW76490.1 hypothetical protein [Burkholderia pseudomallei]NAX61306.1 hypothetical protein [Burkholderia pseudomallei]NAX68133.1 hypothetical protein [Burkholderia pseudomallei]
MIAPFPFRNWPPNNRRSVFAKYKSKLNLVNRRKRIAQLFKYLTAIRIRARFPSRAGKNRHFCKHPGFGRGGARKKTRGGRSRRARSLGWSRFRRSRPD